MRFFFYPDIQRSSTHPGKYDDIDDYDYPPMKGKGKGKGKGRG